MTRINKYLADHQYCSRREADELISQGKVFINNKKAQLGDTVADGDEVRVEGLEEKEKAYFAYYKPKGIVTVNAQKGEQEIKDRATFPVPVYPLGRLDKDSEGLIIMTNDGRLTTALLHPTARHEKEYEVTVTQPITNKLIQGLIGGVRIGAVGGSRNYKTKPAKARKTSQFTFEIILTEGKNRQIRKMCGALGFAVKKLKRFRVVNITLGTMKPGQYREIVGNEKALFLQHMGL